MRLPFFNSVVISNLKMDHCLHNFNNEKQHYIKSGTEKDVLIILLRTWTE